MNRKYVLYGVVFLSMHFQSLGATITANSVSRQDVQAAVNAALTGDTVIVPAGSASWNEPVSIAKAITVQGAGVGQTIISNEQGDGSNPATMDWFAVELDAQSTGRLRFTGFEIRMNRKSQGVHIGGSKWAEVMLDNCRFTESIERAVRVGSILRALIYECEFVDNRKAIGVYAVGQRDESWREPLTLGTVESVVIEDCIFLHENWMPKQSLAVASHGFGSRATWRHNEIVNKLPGQDFFPAIDAHGNQAVVGLDNAGAHRSSRSLEFYRNTITSDVGGGSTLAPVQIRGGTFICFENQYIGEDVSDVFGMREEDGDNRFNYIDPSEYPGYDMHWCWIWDNTHNGNSMGIGYASDTRPFVVEGANLFLRPPESGDGPVIPGRQVSYPADEVYPYTPLQYPHPWRGDEVSHKPSPPTELKEL